MFTHHPYYYAVVPFPSPSDVRLLEVNPKFLTFKWSSVATNCSAIDYIIDSDCGFCPSTTKLTSVHCSIEPTATSRRCAFAVKSSVCGSIVGNLSNITYATLKGKQIRDIIINFVVFYYCVITIQFQSHL